jgi:hypothetical protein
VSHEPPKAFDLTQEAADLRAELERVRKMAKLAEESLERLSRLAEGKQGRVPGVALGWIREVTKDALAALREIK